MLGKAEKDAKKKDRHTEQKAAPQNLKSTLNAIKTDKLRTPDPEEETMTPFSLTFIIHYLNSDRNLDAAEIHGENPVAFVNSSQTCYFRKKIRFRVRISEVDQLKIEHAFRQFDGTSTREQNRFVETGPETNIFRFQYSTKAVDAYDETKWTLLGVTNSVGNDKGTYMPFTVRIKGLPKGSEKQFTATWDSSHPDLTTNNFAPDDGYYYILGGSTKIACVTENGDIIVISYDLEDGEVVNVTVQQGDLDIRTSFESLAALNSELAIKKLKVIEINITKSRDLICADTDWIQISPSLQRCDINVDCSDSQFLYKISLEVESIPSNGDEYAPGVGNINYGGGVGFYIPFEEPKEEFRPVSKDIRVIAKYHNFVLASEVIRVKPIFTFYTTAYRGPNGVHAPTNDDFNMAWKYARWKYDIDISGLKSVRYEPNQVEQGITGTFSDECTLGPAAFVNENICASTLLHENVHGLQDALYIIGQEENFNLFGGIHQAEVQAHDAELLHAGDTGIDQSYIDITTQWRDYYNRKGDKPE